MAHRTSRNNAEPWNSGVHGDEVPQLINSDSDILRAEAGPGTGKTFGLVRRVVRLLHPSGAAAAGKDILVVAFNRVIAGQLQEDIGNELRAVAIDDLPIIRTVHALCLSVIGEELRLLLPHEREAMIYDVLATYPSLRETFGQRAFYAAQQALHNHEAGFGESPELWDAAREWLAQHHADLISDLPRKLLDHLRGGDFTDRLYRYVIVDEFQDLTSAEQQLFFRMRSPGGQLLALGDSRQSIYAFRGNDRLGLRRLDDWAEEVGVPVVDIPLTRCHRCPARIVNAANRLMVLSGEEEMVPASEADAEIRVLVWNTPEAEADGMATKILENLHQEPDTDSHLVMVTRRQFGYRLRNKILRRDPSLKVDLSFAESLLESWPTREAFLFFCLLADPDPPTWRAWLGYKNPGENGRYKPPERNADAYLRFLRESTDEIDEAAVIALAEEPRGQHRGRGGSFVWDRAKRYVDLRTRFPSRETSNLAAFVEDLLGLEVWMDEHSDETTQHDLDALREKAVTLVEEALSSGTPQEEVLPSVARTIRYKVATREPFTREEDADLQVMTLWGAKGMTADHVYLLGLCDEALPGERRDEYPGTDTDYLEEQLRLFYVSMTRAKKGLFLSRPQSVDRVGDALRLGLSIRTTTSPVILRMCRFLRQIMPYLPDAERC